MVEQCGSKQRLWGSGEGSLKGFAFFLFWTAHHVKAEMCILEDDGFDLAYTLRPRQDGRHFADDIFTCIFFNENCCSLMKFSVKYVRKGPIDNNPALVQIMAWRRSGDKPLSEPIMVILLTHICVTRPQWVNTSTIDATVSLLYGVYGQSSLAPTIDQFCWSHVDEKWSVHEELRVHCPVWDDLNYIYSVVLNLS